MAILSPSAAPIFRCPGHALPHQATHTTDSGLNEIPAMTDPLGRHWRQPADIRMATMDETHVILTTRQIDQLLKYDSSYPSGCYDGKCWVRNGRDESWLCWYHPHPQEGKIGIGSRIIIQVEG